MNIVAHNILAMNASRQFNITSKDKAKSTEKLSSGYRINRAADDAAGLSISEKMRRQIRGLSQGVENTQAGVSLCQVADGALAEVSDMLHRITELSIKSANGTNSPSDRQAIQDEIGEILEEIDRIGETTTFNERPIFKGEIPPAKTVAQNPVSIAPVNPGTGVPPSADYEDMIRDSIIIGGTPTNLSNGTYTINAAPQGITIKGNTVAWSEVKDSNGTAIDENAIAEGKYQFTYNGVSFSFEAKANATLDDIIKAVDGTEFQVDSNTRQQNAVTVSTISMMPGTKTDELLQGNPLLGGKTAYIEADQDGISLKPNSYSPAYTKMTWAQMGIDDWSNANGKSFTFLDSFTGVKFTGKIADGATRNEVIDSLNAIYFRWDYIDRDTSSNSSLKLNGIKVPTDGGLITNKFDDVKLSNMKFRQYGGSNDFYSRMGYSSPSDIIDGIKINISVVKNSNGDLALQIASEKGNNDIMPFNSSKTSELSQKGYAVAEFGNFSNTSEFYDLLTVGKTSVSGKKALLETYVGKEIATVKIPSPYKYSITPKQVNRTESFVSKFTTNEGKNVIPDPGPVQPDPTPNVPNESEQRVEQRGKSHLWIQSGCDTGDGICLEIDPMDTSILGIDDLNLTTIDGAYHAMDAVNDALAKLSANRSKIGAQQNRLEHTIDNENNIVENTTAAESRIRDTDMAKEMVAFSKSNILEQAGQAMLAQANQSNQSILNLLQ